VQVASAVQQPAAAATPVPGAPAVADVNAAAALSALETGYEDIYAAVNPSVVLIQVVIAPNASSPQYQQALGSGFVWDTNGHIVTNNHVVDGATDITVTFYDGTTVPAKVVGADPDSDLAVLLVSVPAGQLHPVTMADSTKAKAGQVAIAIGTPFGEQNTLTTGVISALGRTLPANDSTASGASYTIPDVIQTDAPINPGNSGGVLLDIQGHVIGVTAAIESPVQSSSGIGFAIPSAIVQKDVPVLIKAGTFVHSWLGISGTSLTPDLAKAMNLSQDQRGALVVQVVSGSPADAAGILGSSKSVTILGQQTQVGGDVFVALDGQPVKTFDDVTAYLADSTDVGQTVTLTLLRNGKREDVKVTLQARPAATQSGAQGSASGAYLGVVGITMTPDIAAAMGLPTNQQGVLVQQVESGSPADQAGLQGSLQSATIKGQTVLVGGDIITNFGGQTLTSADDLQKLLDQAQPGDVVTLIVVRGTRQGRVRVQLDQLPTSDLQTSRFLKP
jgi:serine protease Do